MQPHLQCLQSSINGKQLAGIINLGIGLQRQTKNWLFQVTGLELNGSPVARGYWILFRATGFQKVVARRATTFLAWYNL